jgi:type I restriction enzyme S subunit
MAAVDETTGEVTVAEKRKLGEVRGKSYRTFAPGDVLFAKITPCMENGKSAIVPDDSSNIGFGSTEFHVLRPHAGVNPRFIWYFVRQESFRRIAEQHMTGTVGQLRVPADFLKEFPIELPPETVQREIVRALDSGTNSAHNGRQHLLAAGREIKRLRQAILAAACSGRLTADWRESNATEPPVISAQSKTRSKQFRGIHNYELGEIPDSWTWVQVDDVLPPGGIFDGPFGSNLKTADYTADGARVIRLENIGHLRFIGSKQTFVSIEKYRTLLKHAVHPGDVIFSSFVEEEIRVCVLPDDLQPLALAKADCFTIRPTEAAYRPYLALQLASPVSHRNLVADIHGATRPRVNTTQVRSLPIPLCSVSEQKEIVRRVTAMNALADELIGRLNAAARSAEQTSQALVARAFRGELPQGAERTAPPETA